MKFTKNASLNLSINAIVILILAITMLGLGLTFMKGLFGKTTSQLAGVSEEIEAKVIEDIESSGAKLTFLNRKLTLQRSETKQLFFGVKNQLGDPENFKVSFGCFDSLKPEESLKVPLTDAVSFEYTPDTGGDERELNVGDVKVMGVNVNANPNADLTTYSCEVKIDYVDQNSETQEYSREEFFVTVE